MKKHIVLLALFLAFNNFSNAQKAAGLYGKCNTSFGEYVCQQVLLHPNGRFEFLDYLHLNGIKINKGKWIRNGDTVILNSDSIPKIMYEKRKAIEPDLMICIDTADYYGFTRVFINSDTATHFFNDSGFIVIPKRAIQKLIINDLMQTFVLNFEPGELDSVFKITLFLKANPEETIIFKNEKWLLKRRKLMFAKLPNGEYNKEEGFTKTRMKNKRF